MYRDKTLQRLIIIALMLTLSTMPAAHAAAEETTVYVDAPEYVISDTFDVEIRIENVDELDSGEFHLIFDPNVVNVTDVVDGSIDAKTVEIIGVVDTRYDKIHSIGIIRVAFNIGGEDGASGSGSLATVGFEVTGGDGNCSFLNISNPTPIYHIEGFKKGKLIDWELEEISANWVNGRVCIGDPSLFDDPADSGNSTDNTSTPDTPEAKVTIFVENRDDDKLFVKLYIDGAYRMQKEIKKDKNVQYYEGRRLTEGVHTFKIEWHDHDTSKDYVKTKECSVSGTTAVTLMTDEHTEDEDKLSAHVCVKNLDDDDLDEVYLYIDEVYKKYKSISSGSTVEYAEYEFEEDEDALHSFKIEWLDPGTDVTYEKITRSYITSEEAVTLFVDKHTAEDMILLSDDMSTPVSTISKSSSTSTRTVKEPTPAPTKTHITEMHTDPALAQDSSEESNMKQHISATCTLVAFVAVLFVLMQIRRV